MGLNATVTPGITVTSSTVLSAANLNLLGTPTVSITGSIDSSDIGADTVGESELINNSVTAEKIGDIGGANYIIKGVDNESSTGISTSAIDSSNDAQISLLVNDTSVLKARYITGHLDVSAATNSSDGDLNALNLTIKDNTISQSMLQTNAVQAHIGNIQPGGGLTANGGVASKTSGEGGGIIYFDPNVKTPIGTTEYYGKAKVLDVPTVADQYLKSTASGTVAFGSVGSLPIAYCQAYASSGYVDHDANATSGVFSFVGNFKSGIYLIRRSSLTNHNKGILRVFFDTELLSSGTNLGVFGFALNNAASQQMMPIVTGSVGLQTIDSSGIEDTENGTEHPYIDIKCILETPGSLSTAPDDLTTTYLRNANLINLTFYQI